MDPQSLIRDYGLFAVFITVLFEQLGLPIPSLMLLLIAGAAAASDPLFGVFALFLASTASIIGGVLLFGIGQRKGDALLGFLCKVSLSPHKCIGHGHTAFHKFGPSALIMARFVPGLATMAPPLAGTIGMPFGVFLTFQSLAALLFSITGLMAGYFFNENVVALVSQIQQHGEIVVYALSTALLIWLLYVFVVKHRY